jgi:hydroxymethylglutaryl-CoA lyase
MSVPARVRIVEVGPRDGLQNEPATVSVEDKVALINLLADAGLAKIEVGSFVSPKSAPQMASTGEVLARLFPRADVRYSVLVPNMRGLEAAVAAGVQEIAVFAAASETFSQKNINCSIADSIERYAHVIEEATRHGVAVRGYVSCVLGCPYEGPVDIQSVSKVARALHEMGCFEISLGDTIGVGTPLRARRLIESIARNVPLEKLAIHFHDTYGQALANIFACLEAGVSIVDSSVAGLGGCPYAPGATGNVATEDVVYMLDGMEIESGVDLSALIEASSFISRQLGRTVASRVARAFLARKE